MFEPVSLYIQIEFAFIFNQTYQIFTSLLKIFIQNKFHFELVSISREIFGSFVNFQLRSTLKSSDQFKSSFNFSSSFIDFALLNHFSVIEELPKTEGHDKISWELSLQEISDVSFPNINLIFEMKSLYTVS